MSVTDDLATRLAVSEAIDFIDVMIQSYRMRLGLDEWQEWLDHIGVTGDVTYTDALVAWAKGTGSGGGVVDGLLTEGGGRILLEDGGVLLAESDSGEPVPVTGFLYLQDGNSLLLLQDGTSKLLLETP